MIKGATISNCGKYRYDLWRIWDWREPRVLFTMLNPSTADADKDDPTIRRCIKFAKDYSFGGMYVCNLFAFRATNPKQLYKADDPIDPENMHHIHRAAVLKCNGEVICAWGNHGSLNGRSGEMIWAFKNLWGVKGKCFGLTKKGEPKHPLYLKGDTQLVDIPNV